MKYLFYLFAAVFCTSLIVFTPFNRNSSSESVMEVQPPSETQETYETLPSKHQQRLERRAARQAAFEKSIDSIVLARTYRFVPTTFNVEPAGSSQPVSGAMFELAVRPEFTDINLPYLRGIMPPYKLVVLNYIITQPNGYTAVQTDNGWNITFSSWLYGANNYLFTLDIYSKTGMAQLTVASTFYQTNTYWGSIMQIY